MSFKRVIFPVISAFGAGYLVSDLLNGNKIGFAKSNYLQAAGSVLPPSIPGSQDLVPTRAPGSFDDSMALTASGSRVKDIMKHGNQNLSFS